MKVDIDYSFPIVKIKNKLDEYQEVTKLSRPSSSSCESHHQKEQVKSKYPHKPDQFLTCYKSQVKQTDILDSFVSNANNVKSKIKELKTDLKK